VPSAEELSKLTKVEGREKIYSYIRELSRNGYFHRYKLQMKNGTWGSACYVLEVPDKSFNREAWLASQSAIEEPLTGEPKAVEPNAAEPNAVYPEAYKEIKNKIKSPSDSNAPRRGRKKKAETGETEIVLKKVGRYRFTTNTNISADFSAYAASLGLTVYEAGWVFNSFRLFWAIKKANVQQPADWWLEQWKKSTGRYIANGRRYRNKTDFNFGGNSEQSEYSAASIARTNELREIVTGDADKRPRVFIE
jgi:hypothetical protein